MTELLWQINKPSLLVALSQVADNTSKEEENDMRIHILKQQNTTYEPQTNSLSPVSPDAGSLRQKLLLIPHTNEGSTSTAPQCLHHLETLTVLSESITFGKLPGLGKMV